MTEDARVDEWDAEALVFDDEPHHALEAPDMRAAWAELLRSVLPPAPATVADLGCGTGSVSVLLAELGYAVTGVDVSPEMVARARAKAARFGVEATFTTGDAADPQLAPVDVVLTRHVAWALPDLDAAVARWVSALRPGGRLVLVEGLWSNGSGLAADDLAAVVRRHLPQVAVRELDDPTLWGYPLVDSRYLLVAHAGGAAVTEVEAVRSHDLDPVTEVALRALLDASFDGEFDERDWSHCTGGVHLLVRVDGAVVAHAAVVPRALDVDGVPYRTGYVEGVATLPTQQSRGLGSAVMSAATAHVRSAYDLGCLSTGSPAFYLRLGWEPWAGTTWVREGRDLVRTADEDDGVMVLRCGTSAAIPLTGAIACEARDGDDW